MPSKIDKKIHNWKFVDDKRTPVFKTLATELDAIARGKKPISFFATDRRGFAEDLAEIEPPAKKRGLAVTVITRKGTTNIFVHRAENAALVGPLQKHLSQSPWTFEHEATLGELLGYTPAQRSAWLAAERHARPGFGLITMYADTVHGYPFPLTWWREPGRVPAPDAYKIMHKRVRGLELWRCGVDPSYENHLDRRGVIELAGAPKKVNSTFDKAIRTELEMLGPKGWHIPPRSRTKRRR